MNKLSQQKAPIPTTRLIQSGFTLIELMVVIAIIAILVKIAVPAYTASIQKSYRSDAKTALLDLATREEKYYSVANTYTASASNLNYGSTATFPLNIQSGGTAYYQLNVTANAASSTSTATFTATATPIAGTTQASDACGTFQITNTGVTSNTSNTTSNCW